MKRTWTRALLMKILVSFLPVILSAVLIGLPIASAQAPDPQQNLRWQVMKDTAAGVVVMYVKDSLGNVYQLMPAGPKLPWGISGDVIEAQGEKYGYRMIRAGLAGGAVDAQHAAETVKERVARAIQAEKTASTLTAVWEIAKLGDAIYVAYTGEGKAGEAQYQVIGATVSSELGLGATYVAGQIGVSAAAGFGVGVLATWAGNNVQQAIEDGLSAWEAKVEARESVKNWKENDVRLAGDLLLKIRKAIAEGDYDQAGKLNKGLNEFTEKRRSLGGPAIGELNALTYDLQDRIIAARKAKQKALEEVRARGRDEYLRGIEAYREEVRKKREREAREKAEFDVRLLIITPNLKPGQQGAGGLILTGGTPPYAIKGDFYGNLKSSGEVRFAFDTPTKPGAYGLGIEVTDGEGRVRYANAGLWIEDEKKKDAPPEAAAGYPAIIRNGPLEVRLNLSGIKVTRISPEHAADSTVHQGEWLRAEAVFTEDRFTAQGSCRGVLAEKYGIAGANVLVDPDNNPGTWPIYWVDHQQKEPGDFEKTFNNSISASEVIGNTMNFHIIVNGDGKSILIDFYIHKQ